MTPNTNHVRTTLPIMLRTATTALHSSSSLNFYGYQEFKCQHRSDRRCRVQSLCLNLPLSRPQPRRHSMDDARGKSAPKPRTPTQDLLVVSPSWVGPKHVTCQTKGTVVKVYSSASRWYAGRLITPNRWQMAAPDATGGRGASDMRIIHLLGLISLIT